MAQPSQFGVQFQGRDGSVTANPGTPALLQSQIAGVVPQGNWNPIDNWYSFTPAANGTSGVLWDSNLVSTAGVTLTFYASDSWYDDVASSSITNANAILLNGIIKSNPGGTPGLNGNPGVEYFQFNNVPEGQYDLYVYTTMNGDGVWADVADNDNLTTYYIKEWHQFTDTSSLVQATNTNPNGTRDTGNYVKFSSLGTYGRGTIGAHVTRRGTAGDGTGVPALELVPAGAAQANTTPLSILVQPVNRRGANGYSNVTFSAIIKGPVSSYQWSKNGTPIPGATDVFYQPAPIASGDNGAQISLKAMNNVNSVTTSNAVLTVGQYITNNNVGVLDGGIVTITQQPQNASAIAGGRGGGASFSVAATSGFIGDASIGPPPVTYPFAAAAPVPPISYQWQSAPKGSSSFTPITGATSASFIPPVSSLISANDGTQYRAAVTASDATVNSSVAVLTVIPNTNPPVASGALVLNGSTQVGVTFDEALDPVTAQTASNYKVNGVPVLAAILRTNVANELTSEQNLVALITAAPITANFTVTHSGVKDTSGNATIQTTINGTVSGLTFAEIGSTLTSAGVTAVGDGTGTTTSGVVAPDPQLPGVVTNWGNGSFDVLAQGNDYWNNADGLDFLYEPKTNSFDVRVQVVSVQGINNWSAGAIMMREGPVTPNGGGWELARHYFCKVDYGGPTATEDASGSGANTYEFNCRLAPGNPALRERGGAQGSNNGATNTAGFSYGWGGTGPGNPSPVPYPNAWIRIARVKSVSNNVTNDHLMGYSGTDGTNWSLREDVNLMDANHAGWTNINGQPAGPWPDVTYVGLGSVSHTGLGNGNGTNSVTGQPYQAWIVYRNWGDTPGTSTPTGPTVSAQHNTDGTVTLTFTGNLYSSATVNGTYTKVAAATSPFKVTPTAGQKDTFYKAGP